MLPKIVLFFVNFLLFLSHPVFAIASSDYWVQSIKHQGFAPFHGNSKYDVFRNVKDFGAKGMFVYLCLCVMYMVKNES